MVASSSRRARPSRRSQLLAAATVVAAATTAVSAQNTSTGGSSSSGGAGLDNGGINATAKANTWAVVGAPQVSAQQLFRGQGNKVGNSKPVRACLWHGRIDAAALQAC